MRNEVKASGVVFDVKKVIYNALQEKGWYAGSFEEFSKLSGLETDLFSVSLGNSLTYVFKIGTSKARVFHLHFNLHFDNSFKSLEILWASGNMSIEYFSEYVQAMNDAHELSVHLKYKLIEELLSNDNEKIKEILNEIAHNEKQAKDFFAK